MHPGSALIHILYRVGGVSHMLTEILHCPTEKKAFKFSPNCKLRSKSATPLTPPQINLFLNAPLHSIVTIFRETFSGLIKEFLMNKRLK